MATDHHEEKQQQHTEPFPDHDAIPEFQIVEHSPGPEAEKRRSKPRKKLRFQRKRESVATEASDGHQSLWIEPERPVVQLSKWTMGMLEDRAIGGVPGTVALFDGDPKHTQSSGASNSAFPSHLPTFNSHSRSGHATPRTPRSPARKRGRDGKLVLEPQPDDSHNDPLNWRGWRKCGAFIALCQFGLLGGAAITMLSTGLRGNARDFDLTRIDLGLSNALLCVGVALGAIFVTPCAILFGKRLVYLSAAWLFLVSGIWAAFSPVYGSLLGARFLMGASISPVFNLVPSSLAELFHLHRRGIVLGAYYFALLGGMLAGSLASAAIMDFLSWTWAFCVLAVASAFVLVLLTFFASESYWDRSLRPVHTKTCLQSRSRANSGRSYRSYFSHCTCPVLSPPLDPHPGKLVTYERLSPSAMEFRAQAHRERAVQRYYEHSSAETPRAAGAIISPALGTSTTYNTARSSSSSSQGLDFVSPRPYEDPRRAPSPPSRPTTAYLRPSLNAHSSSSNPLRTTAQVDFAISPRDTSPQGFPRSRSQTASSGSTLVPSRPSQNSHRTEIFQTPSTRSPPAGTGDQRRSRPASVASNSSETSTYSRSSSLSEPPSPRSRQTVRFNSPYNSSSGRSSASDSPTLTTSVQNNSSAPRPDLRLDLDRILTSRTSVGAFTDHTSLSGYQNGAYFRTFHSASIAGLTATPGGVPRSAFPGFGAGEDEKARAYTEQLRTREKMGWREGLRVWHGSLCEDGYLRVMGRPGGLIVRSPGLVWASLVFAVSVGWIGIVPRVVWLVLTGSLLGNGYALSTVEAAAMAVTTLAGVALGTLGWGLVSDVVSKLMARRNHGVFEPEFRLLGMLPGLAAAGAGIIGFGWMVEQQNSLPVLGLFLGIAGLGSAIGVVTSVGYVVDCLGGAIAEGMAVLTVVASICYGLVLSLILDRWLASMGVKGVCIVLGAIQAGVCLTAVPMYIFGKTARAWGARKTLFEQM